MEAGGEIRLVRNNADTAPAVADIMSDLIELRKSDDLVGIWRESEGARVIFFRVVLFNLRLFLKIPLEMMLCDQ